MGFFSFDCNECSYPMLSHWATNEVNAWMEEVVVFRCDGVRLEGKYDGYGRVTVHEPSSGELEAQDILDGHYWSYEELVPACYHRDCYLAAGKPDPGTIEKGNLQHSGRSECQGYFFDDGDYDNDSPRYNEHGDDILGDEGV